MPLKRSWLERKLPAFFGLFGLLVLIIVTVTSVYVSSEHNFHWWIDWYSRTIEVADAYRQAPLQALQLVQGSLVEERNTIYTLPLIPFIFIFGASRLVYELGLAVIYLLPFSLVMGAIATRIILAPSPAVFWSTVLLTLFIPVNWIPTFIGIPDTGGALFIGLAIFIYLDDIKFKQWWRIPAIGFFLAVAILLRRHFVYSCIAFLGAVAVQTLIFFCAKVRQHPRLAWQNLLGYGVRICLIAVISLSTLLTVAWEFTYQALTTNYNSLYASWSLPLGNTIKLYAAYYGWVTLLIAAIGFSAAIVTRTVSLSRISFIILFGIFSLIIWLGILRYGNVFYALHITPLIVIGLSAFIWTTWLKLWRKRNFILGVIGCYLVSNLVFGLTPIGTFDHVFRPLFALSIPPLVRNDYDEVVSLVNYLRLVTPNQEPISILGHQRLQLNSGTIRAAERLLYGVNDRKLNIIRTPEVDSRDAYPLEALLQAQYVVIPTPLPNYPGNPTKVAVIGEWLPNSEHDVVQVAVDAFAQNWQIAQDFQRLPIQFTLENNTIVNIYQRIRPTSIATALQTLSIMQQQIQPKPGGQFDWIIFRQHSNFSVVTKNPDHTYKIIIYHGDRTRGIQTSLLYLGSLPTTGEITGKIAFLNHHCGGAVLQVAVLDNQGNVITNIPEFSSQKSTAFKLLFNSPFASLLLDVVSNQSNKPINNCLINLDSLLVSPQP